MSVVFEEIGETFLGHHGIKGQKWGVRRKNPSGPSSEDAQRHGAARRKKTHELSDKELREVVNRINMEQQYRRMSPTKADKGRKAIKSVLAVAGTVNALLALSSTPVGKAASKALVTAVSNSLKSGVRTIGVTS